MAKFMAPWPCCLCTLKEEVILLPRNNPSENDIGTVSAKPLVSGFQGGKAMGMKGKSSGNQSVMIHGHMELPESFCVHLIFDEQKTHLTIWITVSTQGLTHPN